MRADLAMMLLHRPELILLDEPKLGLVVLAKRQMISFLKELNSELKTTIIVTSHDMDDLEEMAQRILLISNGKITYDGGTATTAKEAEIMKLIKIMKIITMLTVLSVQLLLFSACGKVGQDTGNGIETSVKTADADTQTSQADPGTTDDNHINESPDQLPDMSAGEESSYPEESSSQTEDGNDAVLKLIGEMSLDEKIGQLFIIGFQGTAPDDALNGLIIQKHIGGVILFKRNINSPEKLVSLNNSIKEINLNSNKVPLFISVDEEGGRISRMPEQITKLPSAESIGKINNSDLSYDAGSLLAMQTKAFGFNMDFAPVLDIRSNLKNTVIGDRAFGTDPETVLFNGVRVMKGIRDGGIIPVVKHFPGHGDTIADSHTELPVVNFDIGRLESFEWKPFQDAIDNQVDAVMIAHILVTKIDPENPASLSKILIKDILRDRMGFDGVVITDDMTMGAIVNNYSIGDAAVKSLLSCCDIIMVCHGHEKQLEAINAVKAAVSEGLISEERLDESVYRILALKRKYHLTDQPTDEVDLEVLNKRLEDFDKKFEALSVK